MRKLELIKREIENEFMNNEAAAAHYGFEPGDAFSNHFSKVSLENILFNIVSTAVYACETLFFWHTKEVDELLRNSKPHSALWYRAKALAFMKDKTLIPDSDIYDTSDMTPDQITEAMVVRHAVATESPNSSMLMIKVAGDDGLKRTPLDPEVTDQLRTYIHAIKDAGVMIDVISEEPDIFECTLDIYYDGILLEKNVKADCIRAIEEHLANLDFNGVFSNMGLVDRLQQVEGVKIVEVKSTTVKSAKFADPIPVDGRYIPDAGYFKAGELDLKMKIYGKV